MRSPKFGFSLAPLAAPIGYAIWALFFFTDTTPKQELSGWDFYSATGWALALGSLTLLSYAASFIFGVPLIAVLKRTNRMSFWWIVLPASILGASTLLLVFAALMSTDGRIAGPLWVPLAQFAGTGFLFGLAVGVSFCILLGIPAWHRAQPVQGV
jgi:hypothetical protein